MVPKVKTIKRQKNSEEVMTVMTREVRIQNKVLNFNGREGNLG
jgi:hypothetical protein